MSLNQLGLIRWPAATLRKLAAEDEALGIAIDAALGLQLSELLHQSWKHEALAKGRCVSNNGTVQYRTAYRW